MKRSACLILLVCFLLSGCHMFGNRIKEPVTFYYIRANYREDLTSMIAAEEREASGHRKDLSYLMALYLMGPVSEQLSIPLPAGTRIYVDTSSSDSVILNLSDTEKTMTDAQFSLACVCLAQTCMEITDTQEVTINSGNRSATLTPDNIVLSDTTMEDITEETP